MNSSIKTLIAAQSFRTLNFAAPIYTLFLLQKGLSLEQILTLGSIWLLSGVIFEIPTGVFGDKYGRKWSLVIGSFLTMIGMGMWLYIDTFLGFVLFSILSGLSTAFWSGSDQALIYDELKATGQSSQAQKVFSIYNGILSLIFAFGSLICGLVAQVHSLEVFYILYKATFVTSVIGFLISLFITEVKPTHHGLELSHQSENALKNFSHHLKLLKNNRKLLKITCFSIFTLSFGLMDLYQVYFFQSAVPDAWYGYILALSSVLIGITNFYAYKLEQWFGVEKSLKLIAIFPACLWMIMSLVFNPIFAMILFIINDVGGNIRNPIISDYQNRHIEGPNRATILSTISLLTNGYIALMLPIIGWIADKNLSLSFLACAALILLGNFFFSLKAEDVAVV